MSELEKSIEKPEVWFDNNIAIYKSLAENVANTLKTALDKHQIMYVDVPCRAKDKKSFLKKLSDKKYNDICEMMDLAGIRIITLVEDDLDAVEDLIRKLFNVHEKDSVDKDKSLGADKFGYRSRHFICDIGPKRSELIELDHFTGLKFEIQLRTALAHAWAEIEHDRGYKLEGGLPENLKRRLNIVAAMLEAADNEFNRLTKDISEYAEKMKSKIASDELNVELSTIGIQELLFGKYSEFFRSEDKNKLKDIESYLEILEDLHYFKIFTIKDLDVLIQKILNKYPKENYVAVYKGLQNNTDIGFLTDILMLSDLGLYFSKDLYWSGCGAKTKDMLLAVYDEEVVAKAFELHDIQVHPELN